MYGVLLPTSDTTKGNGWNQALAQAARGEHYENEDIARHIRTTQCRWPYVVGGHVEVAHHARHHSRDIPLGNRLRYHCLLVVIVAVVFLVFFWPGLAREEVPVLGPPEPGRESPRNKVVGATLAHGAR